MKKLFLLSAVSILLLPGCNKSKDKYQNLIVPGKANVILITGQSNASGNSPWKYLETKNPEIFNKFNKGINNVLTNYYVHSSNNINCFEPTKFGMADSKDFFGPEIGIADVFSDENEVTYIIKFAIGGSVLDNEWLDSNGGKGKYYNDSINWFKNKLGYLETKGVQPNIIGQFWMQGEGDSHSGLEIKYENNLKSLISYYRNDLKDYYENNYTFVDAYISTKTGWPLPNDVNACKQRVADDDPFVYCIKTNGEDETAIDLDLKFHVGEGEDQAHYGCESELLLGQTVGRILKTQN